MQLSGFTFQATDWADVEKVTYQGVTGFAVWQTLNMGDIRLRVVEFSPGYRADHWCTKGHIIVGLQGELHNELKDGRIFTLKPGMSHQIADNAEPHQSHTAVGAKVFIVD